ncbi:MAG: EAL domain-containing protein [Mesorhizobium sp.]|nr:EAL domain-containing protein [Mesorhizobium sp.]
MPVKTATSGAFLLKTALPILTAASLAVAFATAFAVWSASETDRIAIARQERLVHVIVDQLRSGIAHDQESVTVWDDSVEAVEAQNLEWIDVNLGSWMQTYFGHDGAFVLTADRVPLYAYLDGAVQAPQSFHALQRIVGRLLDDLQKRLAAGDQTGVTDKVLSIGSTDIAVVNGHPSIVSVKPIVSDSGEIEQEPGQEALHVAVRYLDSDFLDQLERDYLIENLGFAWALPKTDHQSSVKIPDGSGKTIGYFTWTPYQPGSTVLKRVAPVMISFLVASLLLISILLAALRRRSIKLQASQAEIQHLATHDQLTGLPNRRTFERSLDEGLQRIRAEGGALGVFYLDLDRFKEVNDTLGHPAGDELLREFARRLVDLTGPQAVVARLGGDEFTIFVPDVASRDDLERLAEDLIEMARQPFSIAGSQAFVGVSVGIAIAPEHGLDRVNLTRRADVAMYHAKHSGRSSHCLYSEEMDSLIEARRELENDLREALDRGGQLHLHYQPLYSAASSELTGVEALVRWKHPSRGWISPVVFVAIAEEVGLIHRLGEWVLTEACLATKAWPVETVAVNVSALELSKAGYAMRVANTLMRTGANPRHLELEVTESTFTAKDGECQRNIQALRELGVRFAIDDFGTGFSSLSRLQQLDVDRIKIDRSFVQGFGKDGSDEAIVRAIIDLAKASGLRTTAEGVETELQNERLRSIGCDELQGFLLHKPVPPEEIERLWMEKRPLKTAAQSRENG